MLFQPYIQYLDSLYNNKYIAGSKPPIQMKSSSFRPHVPNITGAETPLKEGELRCYECGQKGHIKPQCPKLKGKQRVARTQFKEIVKEDNHTDVTLTGVLQKKLILFSRREKI